MKKITNPKHQTTSNIQIPPPREEPLAKGSLTAIANKFLIIRILILCIVPIGSNLGFVYWNLDIANAGSVQFSTYYPSPFGMYDRLRLVPRGHLDPPCDPGTLYINNEAGNQIEVCSAAGDAWMPLSGGPWTQVGSNIYATDTTANVGIGTTTPEFRLTLDKFAGNPDGGILAIGTLTSGRMLATSSIGTRLIWYPRKAAFRAGRISGSGTGTEWNDANIGEHSFAVGVDTMASGEFSTATGQASIASANGSTAMGASNTASGIVSTAMGYGNTASGFASTAMGSGTTASGQNSTAMGYATTASGNYSTAMGLYTRAQAYASIVLGRYNIISGSTNSWVNTDPLFVIGTGVDPSSRWNAVTVLKNANVGIGTATPNNTLQVFGLVNFDDATFSTSIGKSAGPVNTGNYNTFLGYVAGAANTTGYYNTFVGGLSGRKNTGYMNTFVGQGSGENNTGGVQNTFVGEDSGAANVGGNYNTFLGEASGVANIGGSRNTLVGVASGAANTSGNDNTFVGLNSGFANSSGGKNIVIGYAAGDNITTGSKNIIIGTDIDAPSATANNQLSIGNLIFGTGLDGTGTTISTGNIGIGTNAPATKLEVVGGPIKATGGMILPTCTIAAGDCPAAPVAGQIWLCTDC